MAKESQNVYLIARNYAKMSRITVAMELNTSESSIRAYEEDVRPVPDDIALAMSRLYRTPWLRVQHLQNSCVFRDLFNLQGVQVDNQAANVLVMQKEVTDVVRAFPAIIENTLANVNLDKRLLRECMEAANSLLVIIGLQKNERTACAGTQTARKVG